MNFADLLAYRKPGEYAPMQTFFLIYSRLRFAAKRPTRWGVANHRVALAKRDLPSNSVNEEVMIGTQHSRAGP